MQKITVAIDGPAGAGKSTIARLVAKKLQALYIDTGAMYRACTLKVLEAKIPLEEEKIIELLATAEIKLKEIDEQMHVFLDGRDVTESIRSGEVTRHVSFVAKIPAVREEMLSLQRQMADNTSVVMDGRDITTHVLPHADVKIYLTASLEERAKRRYKELMEKGTKNITLDTIAQDIKKRDKEDQERKVSPLKKADDAYLLDSTGKSIAEVVEEILAICR